MQQLALILLLLIFMIAGAAFIVAQRNGDEAPRIITIATALLLLAGVAVVGIAARSPVSHPPPGTRIR